ncbi:DUF2804 domain-containing protein [Cohnella lubricantis]|uniref:DUF2804 domain-containing protein n=1 Tax=Cohnella lubricantis TaxID=2163172 RepID=A0A841THS8_9BACL|nr:DUF2804 domain-containing protein [Cohnella lubricantis]MBB6678021.1 DUF2804 domain-containing protein [Cohnella lubricantis]MBP2118144.1 hypothetical protein [Cohnella lubricantis]
MANHNPTSLVENGVRRYGRFSTRPIVNPRDEFVGIARALRGLRLKEWVGFTLIHPDWYSSLIMQDAQYLASSEIYAYNRRSGALHQHAANGRGGSLALPDELFGSRCAFEKRGYRITYDFANDGTRHVLRFDIAATDKAPAFQGELTLDASRASLPLSVSSRLPGGRMYTHKVIYSVSGALRVGGEEIIFDPERDLAILDEHKSFLPYRTSWVWGTFALRTSGGLAGADFAERPSMPGEEEESCIWTPTACEPLADIAFEPESDDPLAPWRIHSRDGRLDVVFEPEGRKQVKHQLGLFAIDYFQLFGHYRGTLRGAQGEYKFDGVHGVCESMKARL